MHDFESSEYIDGTVTQSWLRDFLSYAERNSDLPQVNIDDEVNFARTLKDVYLAAPFSEAALDVEFDANFTRVNAARFLIQVGQTMVSIDI